MKKLLMVSLILAQQFAFADVDCYSPSAVVDGGYHVTVTGTSSNLTAIVNSAGIDNTNLATVGPVQLYLLKKQPPIRVYHYSSKNISFRLNVDMEMTPGGNYPADFTLNTPDGSFTDELNCRVDR